MKIEKVDIILLALGTLTVGTFWFVMRKKAQKSRLRTKRQTIVKNVKSFIDDKEDDSYLSAPSLEHGVPITKAETLPESDEFPLTLGSKGDRVERLKVWLTRKYGHFGIINDEFDEQTQALIERYLKQSEIDEDTYRKLKIGQPVYEQSLV